MRIVEPGAKGLPRELVRQALFFFLLLSYPLPVHPLTIVHRTPLDVSRAKTQGLAALPFEKGLFRTSAGSASLESAVIQTLAPFDDLVGSWNAELPKDASLDFSVRVRSGGAWSAWFSLGRAEGVRWISAERQDNPAGFVDVDTLKLHSPGDALQYRAAIKTQGRAATLRLVAVAVSAAGAPPATPPMPGPWTREITVPPRSQMEEQEQYKHDICSPTALSMALERWGRRLGTIEVAEGVRDSRTKIFGHWPFNAAFAGAQGLEAFVARLDSLDELQDEIAAGRPVVVSVTFGPGELSGAPLSKTKGHLMLVVGFNSDGDVVALDPAAPDRGSARRVYKRQEFHRAWRINKRGLAYLIGPLVGRKMSVGAPVADLKSVPRLRRKLDLDDPNHLSQLLYGEVVTVNELRGDWVRVSAEEQLAMVGGDWRGYPGWMRADALHFSLPPEPNTVVRTRQALVQRGSEMLALSVGTRLARIAESKGVSTVLLTDGGLGELPSDALSVPPTAATDESRSQIIKTAELFLGTSYYWGGRSGVQPEISVGVDCSGLVHLAYRIHGIDVPRDSHEQRLRARAISPRELKPGDLVFLTEPGEPDRVSHVMIYTGGDSVIESRKSSGRVLRSSFVERFGKKVHEIAPGEMVMDLSFPKPKTRHIYFGTYF